MGSIKVYLIMNSSEALLSQLMPTEEQITRRSIYEFWWTLCCSCKHVFDLFVFVLFFFFCNVGLSSSSVVLFADDNELGDFLSLILYLR